MVNTESSNIPKRNPKKVAFETNYRIYENLLIDKLNTKAKISKNKIEIYFDGKEDLENILNKLHINIEDE